MTPLERAARALYPFMAEAGDFNAEGVESYEAWVAGGMSGPAHRTVEAARAVLEAVKEVPVSEFQAMGFHHHSNNAHRSFQLALDHILK